MRVQDAKDVLQRVKNLLDINGFTTSLNIEQSNNSLGEYETTALQFSANSNGRALLITEGVTNIGGYIIPVTIQNAEKFNSAFCV